LRLSLANCLEHLSKVSFVDILGHEIDIKKTEAKNSTENNVKCREKQHKMNAQMKIWKKCRRIFLKTNLLRSKIYRQFKNKVQKTKSVMISTTNSKIYTAKNCAAGKNCEILACFVQIRNSFWHKCEIKYNKVQKTK
jgi:hypothetical protein